MLAPLHLVLLSLASLPAPSALRTSASFEAEYFVVDDPSGSGTLAEARAVCALRRRHTDTAWTLEREVVFRDGPLRVQHVEQHGPDRTRLVWRELGPVGGRTWLAQRAAEAQSFETTTWGATESVHGKISGAADIIAPLEWFARARAGVARTETRLCLAPLTGSSEEWTLELDADWRPAPDELPPALVAEAGRVVEASTAGGPRPLRCYRWLREDGTLARCEVYRGASMITFRWQADGAWARPIDAAQFASLVQKWTEPSPGDVQSRDRSSQITAE